jgi:hypothetical protein
VSLASLVNLRDVCLRFVVHADRCAKIYFHDGMRLDPASVVKVCWVWALRV